MNKARVSCALLSALVLSALITLATGCATPAPVERTVFGPSLGPPLADDFLPVVLPVWEDLAGSLGKQVTVAGFVIYRDSHGPGEFMVARMLVTCCYDDAAPTGFITRWDHGRMPEADEWVRVTGTIDRREVTDPATGTTFTVPYLIAGRVEIIEPYESEYVFP